MEKVALRENGEAEKADAVKEAIGLQGLDDQR
jgi:xylulokinase